MPRWILAGFPTLAQAMQSRVLLQSARFACQRLAPIRRASSSKTPDWKRYEVTAEGAGARCATSDGTFTMVTDVPASMGGGDTGPQPVNALLSALCGCKTATAAFVALKMRPRVNLRGLRFEIRAERDERGALGLPLGEDTGVPAMLQRVEGVCVVEEDISDDEIAFVAHQVHKRCPVANMFEASGCVVDIKWKRAET